MTNRFLISAAVAALIAGSGVANAQGTSTSHEGASGGAATQQTAPSPGGAVSGTTNRDSGMKGAESTDTNSAKTKASQSQGEKSKTMSSETDTKGAKDMKAEGKNGSMDSKTNAQTDTKSGNMNAQTKGTADTAQTKGATDSKSQTTGNAATSATAAPPAEKRTQIVSAIKSEKIEETTNVNFNISVGTAVPASVHFYPLPPRIVEIYPEWRGYDVIFVRGQYVIVRPQTREIVYIIEG